MRKTNIVLLLPGLALCAPGIAASATLAVATATADAGAASAAETDAPAWPTLEAVEVRASRVRGATAFDLPASLDVVDLRDGGQRTGAIASEPLDGIAGVLARDRQNHAQDTQLSIRGFGARSTFGVRGVRLYADGIPASMPDGQGQLSHFNLIGAERIEVMRGPFSALYGNSSGGVVQLWSAVGREDDPWQLRYTHGRDDTRTLAAQALGAAADGAIGYNVAWSRFDTDGYRAHSAARRDSFNARLDFGVGLTVLFNYLDLPEALDPLGLTRAQYLEDPRQVASVAYEYGTRKSVRQAQTGLVFEQALGEAHTLRLMGYAGQREVEQFLSVPVGAQANPLSSGGVIDLDNDYAGLDLRWSWQGQLAGRPFELTVGANADRQRQHRRGYENFAGAGEDLQLGVRGRPRRDERNQASNRDGFVQGWWRLAPRWSMLAGFRHSEVRFRSRDHYVTAGNPDDSGRVGYRQTTPVAGVAFSPGERLRLYLSAGRGFETPTFNEIGYRADGGAGLAFDLRPAVGDNLELGMKWRDGAGAHWEAALFRADTDDELAVARNVGGRSSYRNVGQARRQGLEATWSRPLGERWDLRLAYTWLDAEFRSDYLICTGAGCTVPATRVAAGSRIPGVARQQAYGRLQWDGGPWLATLEATATGDVVVDDLGRASAPGHLLIHLEWSREWRWNGGLLRGFARIDNLFDRGYIGSVIVNEGNGRYFEPGPGRGLLLGAQWRFHPGG